MTTYNELNEILVGRNSQSKILTNNTYAERKDNAISIRLHGTDILIYFPDGRISFNSGGYKTVTTKDRMNRFSPVRIWQNKGIDRTL